MIKIHDPLNKDTVESIASATRLTETQVLEACIALRVFVTQDNRVAVNVIPFLLDYYNSNFLNKAVKST